MIWDDSVALCPYRTNLRGDGPDELADCRRLHQISGVADLELCQVRRDACHYCRKTATSGPMELNAILASILHGMTTKIVGQGGVEGCSVEQASELKQRAEWFLDEDPTEVDQNARPSRSVSVCHFLGSPIGSRNERIHGRIGRTIVQRCHHPGHSETTDAECARCLDWTDRAGSERDPSGWVLPVPESRSGSVVRAWSVGVTTSPRRRPTLEWTLDSLIRAGWERPRLFVDGPATIPSKHGDCPITHREPNVGAWPNFYLSLAELVMRDPEADAYLMIQDDVDFFDGVRLRDYLESILWPGDRPGPVSLYSCQLSAQPNHGWARQEAPWFLGAQAFIFPAESAREFLISPEVMAHRRSPVYSGLANVDTLVGSWAFHQGTPITFPTPSLCRHIGHASTLWPGALIEGNRKEGVFASEVEPIRKPPGRFDEQAFPCVGNLAHYQSTVALGTSRMRSRSVEIRSRARDRVRVLPEFAARVERLSSMFGSSRIVIEDEGSTDGTLEFLKKWSVANPAVRLILEIEERPPEPSMTDYVIVIDSGLEGGWSFEGIAHTFGLDDWDFVGSNSLPTGPFGKSQTMQRGDPPRKVRSCFGGLGIYRTPCLAMAEKQRESRIEALHELMREQGFDRIYLNPSQITIPNQRDD